MKKKIVALLLAGCMLATTACGSTKEASSSTDCENGCNCTDCVCCATDTQAVATSEAESVAQETQSSTLQSETATEMTTEQAATEVTEEVNTQTQTVTEESLSEIESLTEGERAARKEQQANFAEARELLYDLPNSKDKTQKINQMDRQILANNSYDFSKLNIVFIGDSITEGVEAAIDSNGNRITYPTYADSYLHFAKVLNHGKGGRMFSTYGSEEFSLAADFSNITNIDSDITVVFAGVNDYLTEATGKRFGSVEDKVSTAGYCGAVRSFMKQLQMYYGDTEIFFVTMYNISKTANSTYSDITTQPTLNDYMEVQRTLAKEYGFHVIDLYEQGFMDCTSQESSSYYLADELHPNDNGNIALGEHIAAELSLYFSQKQ